MKHLFPSILASIASALPRAAFAQTPIFNGGGASQGLTQAGTIAGISTLPLRTTIINFIVNIITYLSLAALVVVIVAGIWLILGFGTEQARERAQRMIIFTMIGLAIVFLARVIILFLLTILS